MSIKKKKIIALILFIVACFVVGMVSALLAYGDIFSKIHDAFREVFFLFDILFLLGLFYLILIIHEMGHAVVFIINKVKIRAIIIHFFGLKRKSNNRLTLFVDRKLWGFLGGMVIPLLEGFNNEETFEKTRQIFRKSLLAGPIFSIIGWVINLAISIPLILFSSNPALIVFSLLSFVLHTVIFIIVIASSMVESGGAIGDFKAHKRLKRDETFFLRIALQYFEINKDNAPFIFEKYKLLGSIYLRNNIGNLNFYFYEYLIRNNMCYDAFFLGLARESIKYKKSLDEWLFCYFFMGVYLYFYDLDSYDKIITYLRFKLNSAKSQTSSNQIKDILEILESIELGSAYPQKKQEGSPIEKYFNDFDKLMYDTLDRARSIVSVEIPLDFDRDNASNDAHITRSQDTKVIN
jgi:flagellar basal body-associated protein FliL